MFRMWSILVLSAISIFLESINGATFDTKAVTESFKRSFNESYVSGDTRSVLNRNNAQEEQKLRRRLDVPQREAEIVKDLLDHLHSDLISFVNDTCFDYVNFGRQKDILTVGSSAIGRLVDEIWPPSEGLLAQLRFAIHLLSVMASVYEDSRRPISTNRIYNDMLSAAGYLRLKVMLLLDSKGAPDDTLPGFTERVLSLELESRNLESAFLGCNSMPLNFRMMTWEHIIRASKILEKMTERRV